jgi:hypothetical protein
MRTRPPESDENKRRQMVITKTHLLSTLLLVLLSACSAPDSLKKSLSGQRHAEVSIKTQKDWPMYGIKKCLMLTGRPIFEDGKVQPDPHEMLCADDTANTTDYRFEMLHMTVDLDEKAQADFEDETKKKWGVPVSCTRSAETHFECELSDNRNDHGDPPR